MAGTGKKIIFTAIIVIALPALLILLLECGLRLAGFGYPTRLFLEETRDGETWVRDNPDYTGAYFGHAIARKPFSYLLRKEPAAGTTRILILGASAALGDPEPSFSPARILEASLSATWPGQKFECVNLAITAINSHVVRDIARQARALKPDIVIIYLGNNEVIGPFGPGSLSWPLSLIPLPPRMVTAVHRLRLAQLADTLTPRASDRTWAGMEQFLEHRFPADSPELAGVYRAFRKNLHRIVLSFDPESTEVILSTVAVNLAAQPPFSGEEAIAAYRRGLGAPDAAAAFPEFSSARDLDELRFRADTPINRIIREVAQTRALTLVEADAAFNSIEQLAGSADFLEHVHFTFQGNCRLTALLFDAVSKRLLEIGRIARLEAFPEQAALRRHLAYTDYDAYLINTEMVDRLRKPPFTAVLENDRRLKQFSDEAARLQQDLGRPQTRDAILDTYANALAINPDDWVLQRNYAGVLRVYGKFDRAAELLEQVRERFPGDAQTLARLGALYLDMGKLGKAESALRSAARLNPSNLSVSSDLAVALLNQGEAAEARRIALKAIARDGDPLIFNSLVFESYLVENAPAEVARMEALILALDPQSAAAAYRLGMLYAKYGHEARALHLLKTAARLDPGNPAIGKALEDLRRTHP